MAVVLVATPTAPTDCRVAITPTPIPVVQDADIMLAATVPAPIPAAVNPTPAKTTGRATTLPPAMAAPPRIVTEKLNQYK